MKQAAAVFFALLAAAAPTAAESTPAPFVQAAEFEYSLCPPGLWESELVHLKNIGIETVEFSVPQTLHQSPAGDFDFSGRTNPRADLAGFIRLLRRLGIEGWVETGSPRGDWARALGELFAPQTSSHGGPLMWISAPLAGVDAARPPAPLHRISATDSDALARSRDAIASARGSLVWTNVFDALSPDAAAPTFRAGAIGLDGGERSAAALRRDAMLLRYWGALLPEMRIAPAPKPVNGKFPPGVSAALLISDNASAVSIVNRGATPFQDDIRAVDPIAKRSLLIPGVDVAPGDTLWLPAGVSLSQKSLCRECSNFSPMEQILYATAELVAIEYENGILAMEFAAPHSGNVVLQLQRKPVGPFLAAGKPTEFEWDDKTLRARLPIPAGQTPDKHVRIGIAIEEPETSAFFDDLHRLIIGAKNAVETTYSSPGVATRSRLRLPDGYSADKNDLTPNQIEYQLSVPASAADGDYANLALEADGMALGRARVQLFQPLVVRFTDAIALHFGDRIALASSPPAIPIEPKAGTEIELTLRNNWPSIQTYKLEASGDGLDFFPAKTEITIGAAAERSIHMRIFAANGAEGVRPFQLRVSGAANFDVPARAVLVPRTATLAWSADLDEDGSPEWILESEKARAIFSGADGRWLEFTWKDGGLNFLPVDGIFGGQGPATVRAVGDALEFTGKGWKRTVRLNGTALAVEQAPALPADPLAPQKRANVSLGIARRPGSVTYTLSR